MDLTRTYDANTPAGLVAVTLRVASGGRLEDELRAGTGMLRLAGMTDGHRGEGTATNDLGAPVVFQVERSGDQLGIQLVDIATQAGSCSVNGRWRSDGTNLELQWSWRNAPVVGRVNVAAGKLVLDNVGILDEGTTSPASDSSWSGYW